jgi:phosphopantothenoylcysteine decarboxylase/phosphopantothenate--cysteine ligase
MKIALGVTGGIAAYKAAEIVRLLQSHGASVQVVMTRGAQEFVRPLTFAALSGQKVITDMFSGEGYEANLDSAVEHISVAQSIDALLVAPATADILAKFANGIADDFLSTLYLATTAPVFVAPAMNVNMWQHPATQRNLEILRGRGVHVIEPDSGYLACGTIGAGRLAEPERIVEEVLRHLNPVPPDLQFETVLITAGPTHEPIDPVRFLGNRSSGKMGYAIAEAALRRGAKVILVSGPTALQPPAGAEFIAVETAQQMRDAVILRFPDVSAVIMTAAVADYRAETAPQKIKRSANAMTLSLQPTADILAELGERRLPNQVLIGFAAETENVLDNARKKLAAKRVDAIVVNDVTAPGVGFGSDRNAGTIITATGTVAVPETSKSEMASRVLDTLTQLRLRIETRPGHVKA